MNIIHYIGTYLTPFINIYSEGEPMRSISIKKFFLDIVYWFIVGPNEVQEAREIKKNLQKKQQEMRHLRERDQKKYATASRAVTWHYSKVTLIIITVLGVIILGIIYTKTENYTDEQNLEVLINKLENSFLKFGVEIEKKLNTYDVGNNTTLKEKLMEVFELVKINQSNPYKNRLTMDKMIKENTFKYKDANYFSFSTMHNLKTRKKILEIQAASFTAPERTIYLNAEMDPNNILDLLIFYHECIHVAQDTGMRRYINSEESLKEYSSFYESSEKVKPKVIINFELTAYAREIEILNLLLDNKLANNMSADQIIQVLKLRKDQEGIVKLLLAYANKYFPTREDAGKSYSPQYAEFVIEQHRNIGFEIFTRDQNGNIKRVKE